MKRFCASLLILVLPQLALGQTVPLEVKGEFVKTVTVVGKFPCEVRGEKGADLYIWSAPTGVTYTDKNDSIEVLAAPQGEVVISCRMIFINWEAKKVTTKFGQAVLTVGNLPPPKPPDPPPPPGPDDALSRAFAAAYAKDTDPDRAASLAYLQSAYAGMAATAYKKTGILTITDAHDWIVSVVQAPGVGLNKTQVQNLRRAIADEMTARFGLGVAPITLAALSDELGKIATALGKVK